MEKISFKEKMRLGEEARKQIQKLYGEMCMRIGVEKLGQLLWHAVDIGEMTTSGLSLPMKKAQPICNMALLIREIRMGATQEEDEQIASINKMMSEVHRNDNELPPEIRALMARIARIHDES